MSLYADYIEERTKDKVIEDKHGFVLYRYLADNAVYIVDIYVVPELRKSGRATLLADQVASEAKSQGCKTMYGSVVPSTSGSTASLKILLAYGMTLHNCEKDIIFFRKDI